MSDAKTPIEMILDGVEWVAAEDAAANDDGLPFVTHSGVLKIGEHSLRCFRLSNGQAVFEAEDFENFLSGLGSPAPLYCSCGAALTEKEYREHRQRGHDDGLNTISRD